MKIAENLEEKRRPIELVTIKMDLAWYDLDKKMYDHFVQKREISFILLQYVIKWDKPEDLDPTVDAIKDHECLM